MSSQNNWVPVRLSFWPLNPRVLMYKISPTTNKLEEQTNEIKQVSLTVSLAMYMTLTILKVFLESNYLTGIEVLSLGNRMLRGLITIHWEHGGPVSLGLKSSVRELSLPSAFPTQASNLPLLRVPKSALKNNGGKTSSTFSPRLDLYSLCTSRV